MSVEERVNLTPWAYFTLKRCKRGAVSSCEKALREIFDRAADESVSVPMDKQTALGTNLTITVEPINPGEGRLTVREPFTTKRHS